MDGHLDVKMERERERERLDNGCHGKWSYSDLFCSL